MGKRDRERESQYHIIDRETGQKRTPLSLHKEPKPSALRIPRGWGADDGKLSSGQISPSTMSEMSGTEIDRYSSFSLSRLDSYQGTVTGSSTPKSLISDDDSMFFNSSDIVLDDRDSSIGIPKERKFSLYPAPGDDEAIMIRAEQEQMEMEKKLTPEEIEAILDSPFSVTLSETETIFLLDLFDESVALDDPEAESVQQRNQVYQQLLVARSGSDKYTARAAQTFDPKTRNKYTQIRPAETSETGVSVKEWEIYDEYAKLKKEDDDLDIEEKDAGAVKLAEEDAFSEDLDDDTRSQLEELDDDDFGGQNVDSASRHSGGSSTVERNRKAILSSAAFIRALIVMEGTVIPQQRALALQ